MLFRQFLVKTNGLKCFIRENFMQNPNIIVVFGKNDLLIDYMILMMEAMGPSIIRSMTKKI